MGPNGAAKSGKLLVVYYSLTGNTARVAQDIARRTNGDVESLRSTAGILGAMKSVLDVVCGRSVNLGKLQCDPREYPLVLIGSPVWVEHMNPAIRTYLRRFANDLTHVGFFVTSGRTDVNKISPAVERILGRKVDASTGFTARELADSRVYEAKLMRFLEALHCLPTIRARDPISACCL